MTDENAKLLGECGIVTTLLFDTRQHSSGQVSQEAVWLQSVAPTLFEFFDLTYGDTVRISFDGSIPVGSEPGDPNFLTYKSDYVMKLAA